MHTMLATLLGRYYPQIDVCQSEKDGDIAAKKKELELAAEEDFGNSRVSIFYFSSPVYLLFNVF